MSVISLAALFYCVSTATSTQRKGFHLHSPSSYDIIIHNNNFVCIRTYILHRKRNFRDKNVREIHDNFAIYGILYN